MGLERADTRNTATPLNILSILPSSPESNNLEYFQENNDDTLVNHSINESFNPEVENSQVNTQSKEDVSRNKRDEPPKKRKKLSKKRNDEACKCEWNDCDKIFDCLTELGTHVLGHIQDQKAENRSNKKSGYICKWKNCSRKEKPFKGCYNLEHHIRYQHTGEKPFVCKWCPSKFAQRSDMIEHLRNIHNQNIEIPQIDCKKKNMHSNDNSKVRKIMTPRSHPIPILPANFQSLQYYPLMPNYNKYLIVETPFTMDAITHSSNESSELLDTQYHDMCSRKFDFVHDGSHLFGFPILPFGLDRELYLASDMEETHKDHL